MSMYGNYLIYSRIVSGICICVDISNEGNRRRIRATFQLVFGSDAAEQPDGWYKPASDHQYQLSPSSRPLAHLVVGGERGPLPTRLRRPRLQSQDLGHREAR
jgi:hypothetical protein